VPPTTQVRTDLVISAQTKGFDKALRETLGLNQKALDGLRAEAAAFSKVDEKIKGLRSRVSQLAKDQLGLGESMAKIGDKSSAAFKEMEERLRALRQESRAAATEASLLSAAFSREAEAAQKLSHAVQQAQRQQAGDQKQAKGAFTQGLLQTVMPQAAGMFLDRGPGMRRQALGQLVGGGIRRGMGGLGSFLSTPFTGLQGLQGTLAALPGGGLLSGQLGASAAYAGQALAYQRDRLNYSALIGALGEGRPHAQERLAALGPRPEGGPTPLTSAILGMFSPSGERKSAGGGWRQGMRALGAGGIIANPLAAAAGGVRPAALGGRSALADRITNPGDALFNQAAQTWDRAAAITRMDLGPDMTIGGMGRRMGGLSRHEALQFSSQLFQVGGGRYGEGPQAGQNQRMTGAAMAAQTMFGVGPGVSGAFLGAGRRAGSLVGAGGQGADAMTGALRDALEQGLEGAEVTTYLEQMARGIQAWEQTGIPVNKDSLKNLGLEISGAGIAGTRAAHMASGMQQYAQTIGQRGIQGGMDLLMLQKIGGFKGGGAQDYERSIMNLEQMGGDLAKGKFGEKTQDLIRQLVGMGGGARGGGLSFLRRKLQPMMGPMSLTEAAALAQKAGMDTGISDDEFKAAGIDMKGEALKIGRGRKKAGEIGSVEALMSAAARRVQELAPNLAKQADIQNQQLEVGSRILSSVQALESSSVKVNGAFLDLAGPTLTRVTNGFEKFAKKLEETTEGGWGNVFKTIFGMGN
jgi:hypothetical protein